MQVTHNAPNGLNLGFSRRLGVLLSLIAAAIAVWVLVTTAIIIRNAYVPIPLFDGWDHWRVYLRDGKYSSFLFSQHNEHRIALLRVFLYIDHTLFDARSAFVVICNSLAQASTGYFLYRLLYQSGVRTRDTLVLFGSFIACFLFSGQQFTNLTWAYQFGMVAVYSTAVGSILALKCAAATQGNPLKIRLYYGLACALAILSTYSMANGLMIWPVLILLSFCLEMPRRFSIGLISGTAVMFFLYLWGYYRNSQTANPVDSLLHHLPTVFVYSAAFLGSPLQPLLTLRQASGVATDDASVTLAVIFGALGVLTVAILACVLWRARRRCAPAQIALLHVLFFILATSAIVGLGRINFPLVEATTSRYITPAMVFWVALVSLLWSVATPWLNNHPGIRELMKFSLVLAILLGVAVNQSKWIQYSKDYAATVGDAQAAIAAGVYDEAKWRVAYHTPTEMFGPIRYLARNKLSVFSEEWTRWTGLPISSRFGLAETGACLGHFDELTNISTSVMPGSSVSGWAWDVKAGHGPQTVVLVDQDSRIVGVARNIVSRPDVLANLPSLTTDRVGWRGYIAGTASRAITAYVLLGDGKSLCSVGNLPTGIASGFSRVDPKAE